MTDYPKQSMNGPFIALVPSNCVFQAKCYLLQYIIDRVNVKMDMATQRIKYYG